MKKKIIVAEIHDLTSGDEVLRGITAAEQRRLDALCAAYHKREPAMCPAYSPDVSHWGCTRKVGHKGNHVAHGNHVLAIWPREEGE